MKRNILALFFMVLMLCICSCATQPAVEMPPTQAEPVRIALIDTGISQKAISVSQIAEGKNYILPDADTTDIIGHGTAMASIIVGCDAAGISGVCPSAILVPLVYHSEDESGERIKGDVEMLSQIIRDAIDVYDCKIISISAGSLTDSPSLASAVVYAEEMDVLVVASAGNDGNDTAYYPSCYDNVLCVGAVNESSNGIALFSNSNGSVDILAPGENVTVATKRGNAMAYSGTSCATAYISAFAAHLLAENPTLSAKELRSRIIASAQTVDGWKILNAEDCQEKIT